jgi:hypothetical protein
VIAPDIRAAASRLAHAALVRVEDPAKRRVRVEDYLATLASVTGEAALVAAGAFDVEASDITPGSPVFGDPINAVLSGDTSDWTAVPPDSVAGILVGELVPQPVPLEYFGSLDELYRHVAGHVGSAPWGSVRVGVPVDNQPAVLPLQVAFELRPAVDAADAEAGIPARRRHVPCAVALAEGIRQVQGAIDLHVAMTIALQVTFGMAKMAPMSRRAFDAHASAAGQPLDHDA